MKNDANLSLIRDLMKEKKYRGKAKDYIVLSGDMLFDHSGTYTVKRTDFETPDQQGGGEVLLLHKRWLHRFVVEEDASLFWSRKLRMRVVRCGKHT